MCSDGQSEDGCGCGKSHSLSAGKIAAIVICSIAGLASVLVLLAYAVRYYSRKRALLIHHKAVKDTLMRQVMGHKAAYEILTNFDGSKLKIMTDTEIKFGEKLGSGAYGDVYAGVWFDK